MEQPEILNKPNSSTHRFTGLLGLWLRKSRVRTPLPTPPSPAILEGGRPRTWREARADAPTRPARCPGATFWRSVGLLGQATRHGEGLRGIARGSRSRCHLPGGGSGDRAAAVLKPGDGGAVGLVAVADRGGLGLRARRVVVRNARRSCGRRVRDCAVPGRRASPQPHRARRRGLRRGRGRRCGRRRASTAGPRPRDRHHDAELD